MSLITDLLSRVKHEEQKKDIPPGLKDSIIQSAEKKKSRNRMILPLILVLIIVTAGVAAVYYVTSYTNLFKPVARVVPPSVLPEAPPAVQPASPVAPEAAATTQKEQIAKEEVQKPPVQATKETRGRYRISRGGDATAAMQEARRTKSSVAAPAEADQNVERVPVSKRDRDEYAYAARSYETQRDYPRAVSSYKKALAADPQNYVIMNNLAGVLIQMEFYQEAIKYAQQALRIRQNHVPSLVNLGIAYSKMGRTSEGENSLQQALSYDPTNRFALMNLGLMYERRNSLEKSSEYYSKLSEHGDVYGYIGLARIAEKQGRNANAINYYRAALATGRADQRTRNSINNRLQQITLTP